MVKNFFSQSQSDALISEQFRSLTRLMPILYLILSVTVLTIGVAFADSTSRWITIWAPSLIGFLCCLRCVYWLKLRRRGSSFDLENMRKVVRKTAVLGPLFAACLTPVALALLQMSGNNRAPVAAAAIWITAAACASCFFAMPAAAIFSVMIVSAPLCAGFLLSGDTTLMLISPMMATVSGILVYTLYENYRVFSSVVHSREQIEQIQRQTEVARAEAIALAFTDPLTGLANRRCFDRTLRERLDISAHLAIFMLDLDGFKPINDIYGHSVGDAFLTEAGARLKTIAGEKALVARMGGDEFAILFEDQMDEAGALAKGCALVASINQPFCFESIVANMRASCGVVMHAGDGANGERLIEQADIALYATKAAARGGVTFFTDALENAARRRANIEQGLRAAILNDAFDVHFQPIVDIKTGKVTAMESLARWRHPILGPISPAIFIPIAEQIGLIESLTDCLLRKAATIAAQWPDYLTLSFNLSADQLVKPGAALRLIRILADCGLSPARFEAEVTETAIMKDVDAARETIRALKISGIRVSLDDFGTGYSSFSQLCDLPLDKLKIDKSFVDRICGDQKTANVVRAIIGMCQHLDLKCVAEGIEREDQMQLLRELGCAAGQGYLIARPMPQIDIDDFFDNQELLQEDFQMRNRAQ